MVVVVVVVAYKQDCLEARNFKDATECVTYLENSLLGML